MINHVKMVNWRAYDKREVHFEPGITFIMGANGIGKTSILEAIAYGLTGEPSTVKDRSKLLRDPGKLATVALTFTVDDQQYLVERSQSSRSADRATLTRLKDGKQVASSHKRVTEAIERLMGVSADFLQRIIYMAEGDVFRFLDHPPGDALDLQIRQVLGLTQLDEFTEALGLAAKEIRDRISTVQSLLSALEGLGIRQDPDFERHMQEMDKRREQLLDRLRSVQSEITQSNREVEDLQRLEPRIEQAEYALRQDPAVWEWAQRTPVIALFERLQAQLEEARSELKEAEVALARLEGERASQQRVLDLLQPYTTRTETLPCPVCGKPMTHAEREHLAGNLQHDLQRLGEEIRLTTQRRLQAEDTRNRLREQVESLRELRNALVHVRFQSIGQEASCRDVALIIRQLRAELPAAPQDEAIALQKEIARLQSEMSEHAALQHRLRSLGFDTPEQASDGLVDLEIRSLSLRAAHRAAQETLTAQRNVDMAAIYGEVSRIWGAFCGEDDWHIQLDSRGMPSLEDDAGHRLDLSQFSGGEKTALLIMLHTIIAFHFSRSDFLLIDEPLEHLDPINRRSLIRFLVGAYRRHGFQQAIVATFEESLIRKYMSEEGVHVIHL